MKIYTKYAITTIFCSFMGDFTIIEAAQKSPKVIMESEEDEDSESFASIDIDDDDSSDGGKPKFSRLRLMPEATDPDKGMEITDSHDILHRKVVALDETGGRHQTTATLMAEQRRLEEQIAAIEGMQNEEDDDQASSDSPTPGVQNFPVVPNPSNTLQVPNPIMNAVPIQTDAKRPKDNRLAKDGHEDDETSPFIHTVDPKREENNDTILYSSGVGLLATGVTCMIIAQANNQKNKKVHESLKLVQAKKVKKRAW